MRNGNNEIRPLRLHFWHKVFCCSNHVPHPHFTRQMLLIPTHDLWRQKADKTNMDSNLLAILCGHLTRYNDKRRDQGVLPAVRLLTGVGGTLRPKHVGANVRKVCTSNRTFHELQTKIEFVIA